MKRIVIVSVLLLFASSVWAAPVGPGGRIYLSQTDYRDTGDNVTRLLRIDVDTSWNVVTDYGEIASVTNKYSLLSAGSANARTAAHQTVTSPEILHRRADGDGLPTGGNGAVFLAGWYDTDNHVRYYKVLPDGTTTVLHPGTGWERADRDHTVPFTGAGQSAGGSFVVDSKGEAIGYADGVVHLEGANSFCNGFWADADGNNDLTDDCDIYNGLPGAGTWPGYVYQGLGKDDAEVGGDPYGYSGTDNNIWAHASYEIKRLGGGSYSTYYNYKNPTWYGGQPDDQLGMKYLFRNNGIAVGDVDSDGIMDVFAMTTDAQGTPHSGATIVRMADLNMSGDIDDNVGDMFNQWYNDDTLAGSANNLGGADLELIQDPETDNWTLLVLQRGGSGADGRIIAMDLLDNGDFAGGDDAFQVVLSGIETGSTGGGDYRRLYGVEFDADPIPEPGTLLLLGTGVLGLLGYIRRRRMK